MRKVTFGEMPTEAPPENFRAVHFPQLARLDFGTKEGMISRILSSDGANTRELPRTLSFQEHDMPGHSGAFAAGSLWEVTVDGETGILSGKGWLADNEHGHDAEIAIVSKSLFHNSIDLGDIGPSDVRIIEHGDFWDDDFHVDIIFENWSLVKTTIVASPAFKDARAEMADELTASLGLDDPLVCEFEAEGVFTAYQPVEIAAGMAALPAWEHFHRPESDIPHSIITGVADDDGWIPVYGNLSQWDRPHRGYDGRKVFTPRPQKAYREFNRPGVLTDRGQVETGPIVLYGGHVSLKEACDDPRNAWADVRVTAGKHGPWVSGVVRPHIAADDAETYVARASQISGHWKGNDLCMIISCNVPGFGIDGLGSEPAEPDELVASFEIPSERLAIPAELFSFTELSSDAQDRILSWAKGESLGLPASSAPPGDSLDAEFSDEEQAERDRVIAEFLAEHADPNTPTVDA